MVTRHHDAYVICTTPRSGSTLLCSLLSATRHAGQPESYFHAPSVEGWARSFGLAVDPNASERETLGRIFEAALERGRADTGLFGLRLQHRSLDFFLRQLTALHPNGAGDAARIGTAFGRTLYIHLTRLDRIGQAVSWVRAEQTGLWHRAPDGRELERLAPSAPARYDADSIRSRMREALAGDRRWREWFSAEGITPVPVTYESLATQPTVVLMRLLDQLGLDRAVADAVEPSTARLADETSRDWIARFQAEDSRSSGRQIERNP